MKTKVYNPSQLEVELVEILASLKAEIQDKFAGQKITKMENRLDKDNPRIKLHTEDEDGDEHVFTITVIQQPDEKVN